MSNIAVIINDNSTREEVGNILRLDGMEVFSAENIHSGKSILEREKPQMVIIDGINGEQIVQDLKKDFPDLSIICWLQERNAKNALALMQAGAIDCICPPLRVADIVGVVRHSLGIASEGGKKGTVFFLPNFDLMRTKNLITVIGAFLLVLFLSILFYPKEKMREFGLTHKNPTSIAGNGQSVWVGDWYSQSVYQYIFGKDLKFIGNYYFTAYGPLAITVDGKFLWSCDNDLVLRKHILGDNLEIVKTYPLNEHSPSGIAVIKDSVWICDSAQRKVFQYSIDSGFSLIRSYNLQLSQPVGLSYDGKNIWIADVRSDMVYLFEKSDADLILKKTYQLPIQAESQIAGIYPDKKWLYAVYTGSTPKIVRYRKSSLKLVKEPEKKKEKK